MKGYVRFFNTALRKYWIATVFLVYYLERIKNILTTSSIQVNEPNLASGMLLTSLTSYKNPHIKMKTT